MNSDLPDCLGAGLCPAFSLWLGRELALGCFPKVAWLASFPMGLSRPQQLWSREGGRGPFRAESAWRPKGVSTTVSTITEIMKCPGAGPS